MNFSEKLALLLSMSPEDLVVFESEIVAAIKAADLENLSEENVAEIEAAGVALQTVQAEVTRRTEASNRVKSTLSLIAEPEPDPEPKPDSKPEDIPPPGDKDIPVPSERKTAAAAATHDHGTATVPIVGEHGPEVVIAKTDLTVDEIRSAQPAEVKQASSASSGRRLRLSVAGDVPGYSAGTEFPTMVEMGKAWQRKAESIGKAHGKFHVASIEAEFPPERQLDLDPVANEEKIRAVLSPQALVASGGLCAPLEVDYRLPTFGITDRPVKNALAGFNATRGGITFMTPPVLKDFNNGISIITEAEDVSEAKYPKVKFVVPCPEPIEAKVKAITFRMETGEWNRRFWPEQWDAYYDLGLVQHSRIAETELLRQITTGSTAITDGQNLGAFRDLLESYTRIAAQRRSHHRLGRSAPLTVLLPSWLPDLLSSDLLRQLPGDNTYNLSVGDIEAAFRARNLNVSWYLDDAGDTVQVYSDQAAGVSQAWKVSVVGFMFPPGTWLYLDGGSLDVGMIRDTTLIDDNNVQFFAETWEGTAKRGPISYKITNTLCVSGGSSGTVAFTCPGAGS